jgi:transcriptional regulator GlxA family with amidase domain
MRAVHPASGDRAMTLRVDRRSALVGALTAVAAAAPVKAAATTDITPLPRGDGQIPVAFILDNNAFMIDFAGPWEAFQDAAIAGKVAGFKLYTVAENTDPLQTSGYRENGQQRGMRVLPDYSFKDAPPPKVIVMGAQARRDLPEKLKWIRDMAPGADVVMSICTGAFILAKTGLLDGLSATTHHDYYESFEKEFAGHNIKLMKGRRFVDNGKFVTSGGLTSGVDAALHVVARYYGADVAKASATYMEHDGTEWLSGMRET